MKIQAARRNAPRDAPKLAPLNTPTTAAAKPRQPRPKSPKTKKVKQPSLGSAPEQDFLALWVALYPHLELTREIRFHKKRQWRFDFGCLKSKVAIEIEGGIWVNGAHSRGKHFESDAEKYNSAQSSEYGWIVFRLTPAMMRDADSLAMIAQTIEDRL